MASFQRILHFFNKNLSLSSQKYGIRDPGKTRIPDPGPGVKKAPDPGSRSATLGFGPPGSGSVSQRGTGTDQDPAPDPSIIKKKKLKKLLFLL